VQSRCFNNLPPDRQVGDVFDWFALAFWSDEKLTKASEREKSALPVPDFKYRVVAEVVYLSASTCIIDFGLKATSTDDLLPSGCQKGDYVSGEIGLASAALSTPCPIQSTGSTVISSATPPLQSRVQFCLPSAVLYLGPHLYLEPGPLVGLE